MINRHGTRIKFECGCDAGLNGKFQGIGKRFAGLDIFAGPAAGRVATSRRLRSRIDDTGPRRRREIGSLDTERLRTRASRDPRVTEKASLIKPFTEKARAL